MGKITAEELVDYLALSYLNKWFKEDGLEKTIEMIERCSIESVKEVYMNLLRKRGLVK
jgi:hypothetical protein